MGVFFLVLHAAVCCLLAVALVWLFTIGFLLFVASLVVGLVSLVLVSYCG